MDFSPNTLLRDRYRIISQLGQGGMGAVYLAYDTSLDTQVAVKRNRKVTSDSTTQFLREARLLASLRHPNLPRVIDYFISGEDQFLVMDYIPGDDLEHILEHEGPQPVEKVLNWAVQLGSALTYLHGQNPPVIHRDIKPGNLKLTAEGEVILVDFGIAKAADSSQATATGAIGYTPGFAPPEQYGGSHTGPYSDQYSMAATLYTLITGQRPVDSVQRVLGNAVLTPIHLLNSSVPVNIQSAIEHALAVRPEERFSNINEFLAALKNPNYRAPESTIAAPTRLYQPPTVAINHPAAAAATPAERSSSHRLGWLAAGGMIIIVGLLALGLLGVFLWPRISPNSKPATALSAVTQQPSQTPAPTQTEKIIVLEETQTPKTIPTSTDTLSPSSTPQPELTITPAALPLGDGRLVAFVSDRADGKTLQIYTMKVLLDNAGKFITSEVKQITNDPGDKRQPAWSPDGTQLLYSAPGSDGNGLDIFLLDISNPGSAPINLSNMKGDDTDPAWSPDGGTIAFTNTGRFVPDVQAIYFMNTDGSNQRRISKDFQEHSPFWTTDNRTLLYVIFARDHNYLFQRDREFDYATPVPYDKFTYFGRLGEVSDPQLSTDGSTIAYTCNQGQIQRICTADFNKRGSVVNTLTPNNNHASHPSWSPDNQYLLFTSEQDGRPGLFIMTSAGQMISNLSNSPSRDLDPAWQPPAR